MFAVNTHELFKAVYMVIDFLDHVEECPKYHPARRSRVDVGGVDGKGVKVGTTRRT